MLLSGPLHAQERRQPSIWENCDSMRKINHHSHTTRIFMKYFSALRRVRSVLPVLLVAFATHGHAAQEGEIPLVRNGQAVATIVIAAEPTRAANLAALELQSHIKKITGATLPIVTDAMTAEGPLVLVGESRLTQARGLHSADFKSQEYLIRSGEGGLVLMGRDKDDRGGINYATGEGFPTIFDEQGTLHAVYDFLERHLGVHWYLPSELGTTFRPAKDLSVGKIEERRSPAMTHRFVSEDYRFPGNLMGDTIPDESLEEILPARDHRLFYLRNRIGGEERRVNHSLEGYYDRFLKLHPEWFSQGGPPGAIPTQMCFTNEEFIRQVIQDADDFFSGKERKPGEMASGDAFSLVPMDSGKWCACPACQAELLPKATRGAGLFSNDRASNYIFRFANKVAREIRKKHPQGKIAVLAYSDYAYPPDFDLEPNITVQMCLHNRAWEHSERIRKNDLDILNSWKEMKGQPELYLWLYYCFPSLSATQGQWRAFPGFFAHEIVKHMELFRKDGIRGIKYEPSYLAGGRQSPLFDQLEFYVTWRLADDPALDGNKLIDEFFTSYYGPAAEPMRRFYNMVERIYNDPANYSPDNDGHLDAEISWKQLGTKERMDTLGKIMEEARQAVATGTEAEKARVQLFDNGIWKYMQRGAAEYAKIARVPSQSLHVPRIETKASPDPATLDWSQGAVMDNWNLITGGPDDGKVKGWLLHDGTHLYIKFENLIPPAELVDRGAVWHSDEYELFFAGARRRPYRQIGIHFKGHHEALEHADDGETAWKNPGQIISDLDRKDRWTLYFVIPLANLKEGGAKPGETFYMNAIRMRKTQPEIEGSLWNRAFGDFHNPTNYGEIILDK